MGLEEYRPKRNLRETPEPVGGERRRARSKKIFVVQKHDATRLHYDFRLEIGEVLVSWAVPKGPSMNPADKRLAIQTEDHPIEYAGFEGVIPEGQYGAGVVMVWDKGGYEPEGEPSPEEQLERGEVKMVLHGKRLRGEFVLVRTGGLSAKAGKKKAWLLIKHRDEYADPEWDIEAPSLGRSALTGRTMKEIAEERSAKRRAAG
jgi:bifunctional non-homologous end joining protein LigD